MAYDYAFEMSTSNLRYGPGVSREVGMDLVDLGVRRVMVLTDSKLKEMNPVQKVLEAISDQNIDYALFDQIRIEPTDGTL